MHRLTTTLRSLVGEDEFVELLERRLVVLARVSRGADADETLDALRSSAVSRRFLAEREGDWDDGDENLVRGELDRWEDGIDPRRDIAARLIAAADHIGSIRARPQTLWFLLWEMEGMLADLLEISLTERSGPPSRT